MTETVPEKQAQTNTEEVQGRFGRFILPCLSLTLFIVASVAIYQVLAEISYAQIVTELANLSSTQILLAVLFTVASYLVLSGYDWSALSYLGFTLPFRTVALATFCGCAIANTIGFNLLSGGSVRYRIYVANGLDVLDVARITLFGMIAFGICTSVIAATALIVYPELAGGFLQLPPELLKSLGLLALILFGALVILTFVRRAPLRIGRWMIRLPSVRITITQLLIAVSDMVLAGGCLYILLPDPPIPFLGFLMVYVVGVVAGMVSHVPGGLGVFDGIILYVFRQSVPTQSLVAALLIYRVIYYLAPLILATMIMAAREIVEHARNARD